MADVTRRGFLARLGAVVALVGTGIRISKTESTGSKYFIKDNAVGTTDPTIDYRSGFVSSYWRAGESIRSGQLVSRLNNRLYPARGNIIGVALSDGRRGQIITVIDRGITKVKL